MQTRKGCSKPPSGLIRPHVDIVWMKDEGLPDQSVVFIIMVIVVVVVVAVVFGFLRLMTVHGTGTGTGTGTIVVSTDMWEYMNESLVESKKG